MTSTCCACSGSFQITSDLKKRLFVLLILVVIQIVYLILGGVGFGYLESQNEQQHKRDQNEFNMTDIIGNLTALFPYVPADEMRKFASRILEAERNDVILAVPSSNWDIHSSIFFAMTVVTTIGYGKTHPVTGYGQLFCCFFAFVGIPFTMVILLYIGEIIKTLSKKIEGNLFCSYRPYLNKCVIALAIAIAGIVIFILCPALIFMAVEGWHYGSAIYYGIITATTVGFGDYVAAWNCDFYLCPLYRVFVGIWIFLGLAWMAGYIAWLKELMECLILKCDPEAQNTELVQAE